MTAFSVNGMTQKYAFDEAKRKVEPVKKGVPLTRDEYQQAIDDYVKVLMEGKRAVSLAKFDSPEFAKDFLELAKRQGGVRLSIKKYVVLERHMDGTKKKGKWFPIGDAVKSCDEEFV